VSESLSPRQFDELCDLITALHEKWITEEEAARLEEYVCRDEEACRLYVQCTHLYANLRWREMQEPENPQAPLRAGAEPNRSPVLGFLGDAFQAGMDFLSRGLVVSLLLSIGLPGVLLLILMVHLSREPVPKAVARVVRTHQCVLARDSAPLAAGVDLYPGQHVHLSRGLAEVRFGDRSRVVLQGPCEFEARSPRAGFLGAGSLVARVPKGAEGFAIRTPAATVVDLGTEFGVRVPDSGAAAEVQVFRGAIALETEPQAVGTPPTQRRVTAGHAARVERAQGQSVFREVPQIASGFVRRMPKPAIVADFSGGSGQSAANQYPGAGGEGWNGGWYCPKVKGIKPTIAVDRAAPTLGDGDYLRVLLERESGKAAATRAVQRELSRSGPVDLTKPYVVSLTFRLDVAARFDRAGECIILCNNQYPIEAKRPFPTSGWHIRFDGGDYANVKAKHWVFASGDGKGDEERIDSGIPVVEGSIYSIRVLVDPATTRWTPSIAVNGGPWTTFKPMGMRSRGTAAEREYWPYFYLFWRLWGGNQGDEREKLGFSVDSIRITAAKS